MIFHACSTAHQCLTQHCITCPSVQAVGFLPYEQIAECFCFPSAELSIPEGSNKSTVLLSLSFGPAQITCLQCGCTVASGSWATSCPQETQDSATQIHLAEGIRFSAWLSVSLPAPLQPCNHSRLPFIADL